VIRVAALSMLAACAHPRPAPIGRPAPPAAPAPPETSRAVRAPGEALRYDAWLSLRATRIRDVLVAVVTAARAHGGRIEKLGEDYTVVRVPVAEFPAAWAEIRRLGVRLDERVFSADVGQDFVEVDLRVRTLTAMRDRLVALLARAESDEDKAGLLAELRRTTEELEVFQRQLARLAGLTTESRIAVQVTPSAAFGDAAGFEVQGFGWIGLLSAFERETLPFDHRLPLPVPDGMVLLSQKGRFAAEGPEGAAIWTDQVANEPRADGAFWIGALEVRLRREFGATETRAVGSWTCLRLTGDTEPPYTWDVCAAAAPDDRKVRIAQAYYPDDEARVRYQPAVENSLRGGAS
jgi:hypothetical protein